MPGIAAHRRYLPYAARTPLRPFSGSQPVAVIGYHSGLPEDQQMLKLVNRSVAVRVPSAVRPDRTPFFGPGGVSTFFGPGLREWWCCELGGALMPFSCSSEFRVMVLGQVCAGRSVAGLARDLEMCESALYRRKRQGLVDRGLAPGVASGGGALLRAAGRRIMDLEAELAAVRRASELFAGDRVMRPKGLCPIVGALGAEGHGRRAVCWAFRRLGSSAGGTGRCPSGLSAGRGLQMPPPRYGRGPGAHVGGGGPRPSLPGCTATAPTAICCWRSWESRA